MALCSFQWCHCTSCTKCWQKECELDPSLVENTQDGPKSKFPTDLISLKRHHHHTCTCVLYYRFPPQLNNISWKYAMHVMTVTPYSDILSSIVKAAMLKVYLLLANCFVWNYTPVEILGLQIPYGNIFFTYSRILSFNSVCVHIMPPTSRRAMTMTLRRHCQRSI